MADRLLRHIPTGILHIYQMQFAMRDDFEEVIDVESRVVEEPATPAKRKAKPASIVHAVSDEAVSEDASRNLP